MHAIVDDRNQQYRVAPGDRLRIALLSEVEQGATLTFDKVCAVLGDEPLLGLPYVDGISVTATVLGTVKGQKLFIQKFRRRKNYRRRTGFRARFTEIQIESINR